MKTFSAIIKNKGIFFDDKPEYDSFVSSLKDGQRVAIEIHKEESRRTLQQNSALHLWFEQIAEALNDAGYSVHQVLEKFKMEIPFTQEIVKEMIWRPAQKAMFKKTSTTRLAKHEEIDMLYDVVNRFLSEKFEIENIPFPSLEILAESEEFLKK